MICALTCSNSELTSAIMTLSSTW